MIPSMRKTILNALKAHAMGDIKKHLANMKYIWKTLLALENL